MKNSKVMNNKLPYKPGERLFWISLKYATFGIVSLGGVVIEAPPIAAWMRSQSLTAIKPWLLAQKATVVEIKCL